MMEKQLRMSIASLEAEVIDLKKQMTVGFEKMACLLAGVSPCRRKPQRFIPGGETTPVTTPRNMAHVKQHMAAFSAGREVRNSFLRCRDGPPRVTVADMTLERIIAARPWLVNEVIEYIQARPNDIYSLDEPNQQDSVKERNGIRRAFSATPIKTRYGLKEQLGEGTFGKVVRAVRQKDSKVVAIKLLPKAWISQEM